MNRSVLFILILLTCVGCTTDFEETNIPENAKKSVGSVVPVEEALGELTAVMGAISSETRSGASFDYTKVIQKIAVSGGSQATRSEESNLPDTMVYVVNFTDDKGFAVLGAQRSLEPVYAITESGSFDANKLNAAIAEAQKRSLAGEEAPATRTESEPEAIQQIGTDFAYILLAEALVAAPRIALGPIHGVETYKYNPWVTNGTIGPLVEVKWNQTYPFNMSMPTTTVSQFGPSSSYKGRFPVGCGIIAAAQVMTCTRKPILAPAGTANYSWSSLKSISNYTNLGLFLPNMRLDTLSLNTQTYTNQLSKVLYYLSICFKATSDSSGTGVFIDNVAIALRNLDPAYYNNAQVASVSSSIGAIYSNLENNKPMYVRGSSNAGGHAWVLDGYLNRSRSVTMQTQVQLHPNPTTLTWTEHSTLWHLNWGYQGKYDGYFTEGVFNMTQRIFIDDVIDTSPVAGAGSADYSISNLVILY